MPGRVGVLERVEARICIAMIIQRIARRRHDRVRREELAQRHFFPLAREVVARQHLVLYTEQC